MTDTPDNPAGRPTKPCEAPGCGAPIVRPDKCTDVRWKARRYCNRVCTGIAAAAKHAVRSPPPDSKPCGFAGCDVVIHRRRGESPGKWRDHMFCSRRCVIRNNASKIRKPESDETKGCALHACETVIRRKRTQSDVAWAKVRFCSAAHASASRRTGKSPRKTRQVASSPGKSGQVRASTGESTVGAPDVPEVPPAPPRPIWRPRGFTLRSDNEYHLKSADEEMSA